jgi:hypothetical protein
MSLSVHCFENLSIKRCIFGDGGCFCGSGRSREPTEDAGAAHVLMIQDLSLDLCVVNAPHRHLTTVGEESDDGTAWDYLTVDKDLHTVMVIGERFEQFLADPAFRERPDAMRGQSLAETFTKGIVDILSPLLQVAITGSTGQLHTIFRGHNLTLFAFPLLCDTGDVIGAHVMYRPTKYNQVDIAKLISRGRRSAAESDASALSVMARRKPAE